MLKIAAAKSNLIFLSSILLMVKLEIELRIFDLSKCLFQIIYAMIWNKNLVYEIFIICSFHWGVTHRYKIHHK